eukprot:TRINITY_DN8338_c0_g1_i1.p1 TRINITY_DN8338_c0_g1~~TRINITY_DN8338_c0_g1_i1.p1  ORF type:complete len:391 (+),score=48.57 TRINITY_DN8338_c0_g1_i1:180-1352(+)
MCIRDRVDAGKDGQVDAGKDGHVHPLGKKFVVEQLGYYQDEFSTCTVLEWIPGRTVRRVLLEQKEGRLPVESCVTWMAEVVVGLEFLHSRSIIYEILNPDNILLNKDGHVVLSDGSLSLGRGGATDLPPSLIAQQSNGYVSPEQLVPGSELSIGVDWWMLGILLYELLSGTTPFQHSNAGIMARVLSGRPVYCPMEWSDAVKQFIKTSLKKQPSHRFEGLSPRGAMMFQLHGYGTALGWDQVGTNKIPAPLVPDPVIDENSKGWHVETNGDSDEQDSQIGSQRRLLRKADVLSQLTLVPPQVESLVMGRVAPGQMERVKTVYQHDILPNTKLQPGFRGSKLMRDEDADVICMVCTWASTNHQDTVHKNGWLHQVRQLLDQFMQHPVQLQD